METLDSVIVTLVLKMKEIVMLMMSVKVMVLLVDSTIVLLHWGLTLILIVVSQESSVQIIQIIHTRVMHMRLGS